jgi:hypothetical protein
MPCSSGLEIGSWNGIRLEAGLLGFAPSNPGTQEKRYARRMTKIHATAVRERLRGRSSNDWVGFIRTSIRY